MFVPSAIELRQQSFLWADDLSTYDAFITFPFHIYAIQAGRELRVIVGADKIDDKQTESLSYPIRIFDANPLSPESNAKLLAEGVANRSTSFNVGSLSQLYQRRNGKNRAGNTGSSKHCPWLYVTRLQSVSGA